MNSLPMIFLSLLLCACTTIQTGPSRTEVVTQAQQRGFQMKRYATSYFLLTTYQRISAHPQDIHIYIEGDGHSWKTRYQLSDDPTPQQPLGLLLAINDPHPDVCYIARPCQYTPLTENSHDGWDSHCNSKYWSSHRYAPEVIQSTMDVLDTLKDKRDIQFKIVGFSGGASVATLLTSQRKDIVALVTVAGDLNHDALNKHHHTSPLTGSLNPIHVASNLRQTPQHHLVGKKDKIVPAWVSQQFSDAVNQKQTKIKGMSSEKEVSQIGCVKRTVLSGVTHHQGWVEKWPEIISQEIGCIA